MFEFTRRAIGQLRRQASDTRRLARNDKVFRVGPGNPAVAVRVANTQWLRITSNIATNGFYPALVQVSAVGGDLDASVPVWLGFPAGYQPTSDDVSTPTLFLGRQDADNNGQPAFTAPDCTCHYASAECCPECYCTRCNSQGGFPDYVDVVIPAAAFQSNPLSVLNGSTVRLFWQGTTGDLYPYNVLVAEPLGDLLGDNSTCIPFYQSAPLFLDVDATYNLGWVFNLACAHYEQQDPDSVFPTFVPATGWVLGLVSPPGQNAFGDVIEWYVVPEKDWNCSGSNVMTLGRATVTEPTPPAMLTVEMGAGNNFLAPELPLNLYLTLNAPCPGSYQLSRFEFNPIQNQLWYGGDANSVPDYPGDPPLEAICNDGTCEYGCYLWCLPSGVGGGVAYQLFFYSRAIGSPIWTEGPSLVEVTGVSCDPIFWIFDYRSGVTPLADCNGNPINFRGIITA